MDGSPARVVSEDRIGIVRVRDRIGRVVGRGMMFIRFITDHGAIVVLKPHLPPADIAAGKKRRSHRWR